MFRKLPKKRLAAVGFIAALAITGVSFAYFTGGTGSVTGSGNVGTSSAWTVTTSAPTWSGTLTALYPGVGAANDTEYLNYTVTNNGKGNQSLASVLPTLPKSGNDVTSGGADVPGCLASWFQVASDPSNPAFPTSLAPGATYSGKIDLTMLDPGVNQDACQGKTPAVLITASS
jgi:hypothetical protein